jgi:hypothetical protein
MLKLLEPDRRNAICCMLKGIYGGLGGTLGRGGVGKSSLPAKLIEQMAASKAASVDEPSIA